MAQVSSLVAEFEAIQTVEDLNEKAPKLHNFFQTVSGLTKIFKFHGINSTVPKKPTGPNAQKKQLYDKNNKHEIQALFERQQHRAVQEILIGPTIICDIPQEKVEKRYYKLFSEIAKCNISELPQSLWQSPILEEKDNKQINKTFTTTEIKRKLQSKIYDPLANSRTVGLDKLKYIDLFNGDEECLLLKSFFNACLRVQAVPDIWKKMYSVLIKNSEELDNDDIKNWHTVTMINSIPKLFQSLLVARLIVWAKNSHRLSSTQKGLLSYNAACESSFILQECQNYAEKNNHDLAVAWLDFSNASDSIPQEAVFRTLIQHSVPISIRNIIQSSLHNVETKIRLMLSDAGFTKPIQILKGLPQGCPINPILLDLVLEPVIRTLAAESDNMFQVFNKKINHFAIPNELVLIAESATKLQDLLKVVEKTAQIIGLQFKVDNSSTYHYDSKVNKIKDSTFVFFGQKLTALPQEKIIDYFGVRQGLSIGQNGIPTVEEMIESVKSLSNSKLNIFQKNKAIQNFVMPRAENCLRGLQNFNKEFIANMDNMLKDKFKSWLAIPEDAAPESIVFQSANLSIRNDKSSYLPLLDLFYIMKIAHAFKMLTSEDETVKNIAVASLTAEVFELMQKKTKTQIIMQQIVKYLSGELHTKVTENDTVWKMVREATLNLKMKINFTWKYDTNSKEIQIVIKKSKKPKVISGKFWSTDVSCDLKAALINHYVNEVKRKNPDVKNPGYQPEYQPESKPGSKTDVKNPGYQPGLKHGSKVRPKPRPTNATNKCVTLKRPTEKAPFNMHIGFPTICGLPPFTQGVFIKSVHGTNKSLMIWLKQRTI